MEFIKVYNSALWQSIGVLIGITTSIVLMVRALFTDDQKEAFHGWILCKITILENLQLSQMLIKTYKKLDVFLGQIFGFPRKYKFLNEYYFNVKGFLISTVFCVAPAIIFGHSDLKPFIWGPVTFINLISLVSIKVFKKDSSFNVGLKDYLKLSFFNYLYYAPFEVLFQMQGKIKFANSLEIMRTHSLIFSLFTLLLVFAYSSFRNTIHKISYAQTNNQVAKCIGYFFIQFISISSISTALTYFINFLIRIQSNNSSTISSNIFEYSVCSIFISIFPLIIALVLVAYFALMKIVIIPLKFITSKVFLFIINRRIYSPVGALVFLLFLGYISYKYFSNSIK